MADSGKVRILVMKRIPATAIRLALVWAGALCLTSCYVTVQGSRYLALLAHAVPAKRILSDPHAPAESRELITRALSIREFAINSLGLKDTKNYKALVDLKADRLATIVSACDSDSFNRYLWNYPVVGKLPYKGFFKPEEAEKEAARLKAKGLDVIIRPVDAFSTLGWFADPLFSFMAKYDDAELAETIIHEMAHATLFLKKDDDFNEEFATFVGRQGALAYIQAIYGPKSAELEKNLRDSEDTSTFAAYLRETANELESVFSSDVSREEKLARKAAIIHARADAYKKLPAGTFHAESYRAFPMEKINNAYLDLYRLYEGEPALYRDFLKQACSGDLALFIRKTVKLAAQGGSPKDRMRSLLVATP
jgi:predicted aminopeptidase